MSSLPAYEDNPDDNKLLDIAQDTVFNHKRPRIEDSEEVDGIKSSVCNSIYVWLCNILSLFTSIKEC